MNKPIFAICFSFLSYCSYSQYSSIISTNSSGQEYALDFIYHSNSYYYITGIQDPGPLGNSDIIVTKLDTNNNVSWTKAFGDANYNSTAEIKELNDSNLLLIGYNTNFPYNYFSSILNKLDQNGDTLWTTIIYDSIEHVFLRYMNQSGDTIQLFGEYGGGDSLYKGIIVAVNALSGQLIWSKAYSIIDNLETHFYRSKCTKFGNRIFILSKTVTNNAASSEKEFLNVFDMQGNPVQVIEIADSATSTSSLIAISDQTDDILIGMNNHRNSLPGGNNYLLCLLDSSLNLKYAKEFGAGFGLTVFEDAIFLDSLNMISLMGGQSSVYQLDSTGSIVSINKVYYDALNPGAVISLYKIIESSNKLIGAGGISLTGTSSQINVLFSMAKLNGTGCYNSLISGNNINVPVSMLNGIMHVDTINTLLTISSMNYLSITTNFSTACQSIGYKENNIAAEISLFPNPVIHDFNLSGLMGSKKFEVQLFDCLGQKIQFQSHLINENTINVNIDELPAGLYTILLFDKTDNYISKRLIKI